MRSMRWGRTRTPPFAITEYARAIWTGVTAMPCPIGTVPIVDPDHSSTGRAKPADSPGKSMPVRLPKPKRSTHEASRPAPRRSAIVIVPMFDDCSTICFTVRRSVPRMCASWITRSATWIVGASTNDVRGVTTLSWSAAVTVTSLNVEPGSYVSVTARLRRRSARVVGKRLALKRGAVAIARTEPVYGSITTAVAALAPHRRTVSCSTSSAFAWICWSIVSRTLFPGVSGLVSTTSSARPNGSFTIVWLPGLPASVPSSERSSPSRPLLSRPAYPRTCAATGPCG